MTELKSENFETEAVRCDSVVLVEFRADWCGFCRSMERTFRSLESEHTSVKFFSVDIDAEKELAQKYSIKSIPTVLIFSGGDIIAKKTGVVERGTLNDILTKAQKEKVEMF